MEGGAYPKWQWVITLLLLVAALALIVLHLALEAGDDDAPGWIIPVATASALACTLVAAMSRRQH